MDIKKNPFWINNTSDAPPPPLPPPSFKARAFMPEEQPNPDGTVEPDATIQAWSNRIQARKAALAGGVA